MRVRLALEASVDPRISGYAEIQDVRVFGEETSTLTDFRADNLDLHQAFIRAVFGGENRAVATVGRQEANLGGQRLVGAVGWSQQGRSFDGARVTVGWPGANLDLLAYQLAESDGTGRNEDGDLLGAYLTAPLSGGHAVEVYALRNRMVGDVDTRQVSAGARVHGTPGLYRYRIEGTWQTGTRADDDVAAYMFGIRGGRSFREERATLVLWLDWLSGDDNESDGRTRVFDTLFATNHKFYGFADVFLNIPVHTGGRGLVDAAVKGSHRFADRGSVGLDVHAFRAAESQGLSTASLGQELDLTVSWQHTPGFTITGGLSQVIADDGLVEIGRLAEDLTFGYLMLDLVF